MVGGPFNDLTDVGGDLVLDGTLDVATTPGGAFDPGVYRVINYGGALTDNGLGLSNLPSPGFSVQTSVAHQVNLINTAGLTLDWWDGDAGPKFDGVANGGSGVWQGSAGNDNWTEASGALNAPFTDGGFAIFGGAAGTVTVDDSLGGVAVAGMQFLTDGYIVQGDPVALAGATETTIRVGDGSDGERGDRHADRLGADRRVGAGQDRPRHARADRRQQLPRRHPHPRRRARDLARRQPRRGGGRARLRRRHAARDRRPRDRPRHHDRRRRRHDRHHLGRR